MLNVGRVEAHYNVAGTRILKYTVEMSHAGLREHKLISAPDPDILENKSELQAERWEEKWSELEKKRNIAAEKIATEKRAEELSKEAENALLQIQNLLTHTLSIDDTIDWESLKDKVSFKEKKPLKPGKENYHQIPERPEKAEERFTPKFSFFEKLFNGLKNKKIALYDQKFSVALDDWEDQRKSIEFKNKEIDDSHEKMLYAWLQEVERWEGNRSEYLRKQAEYNTKIDSLKSSYLEKNPVSVVEYCEMVLNNSEYPDSFSMDFQLEYNQETGILIVEYQLPSIDLMPKIKEVKYVKSKNELKETYFTEPVVTRLFDEAIYMIALRTIHELFESDAAGALEFIAFNGWVRAVNKATGNEENNCIVSLQVKKSEFELINLSQVDPKICFKNLKGVAGSKLSSLTPVKPILEIEKTDKRFVDSYEVAGGLDGSTNIAAMDWEDFEHLIREIFEKEFKSSGGEVKVTQASRDGGVDAVAFDPDPIRGGKIVIQAKRYTNTVGVSAVRDLYGTVMNEGATKGILVSTADYGPDAYDFAKGKPLTLISGSNLLHLLEKHGTHAKIDLKEAKKIIAERDSV